MMSRFGSKLLPARVAQYVLECILIGAPVSALLEIGDRERPAFHMI
jgi:hypothetical protein